MWGRAAVVSPAAALTHSGRQPMTRGRSCAVAFDRGAQRVVSFWPLAPVPGIQFRRTRKQLSYVRYPDLLPCHGATGANGPRYRDSDFRKPSQRRNPRQMPELWRDASLATKGRLGCSRWRPNAPLGQGALPNRSSDRWRNREAIGNEVVAIKSLQDSTACWASVLPLNPPFGSELDAPEPGTTFAASNITLFHNPAFRSPKPS
jgi:hypothetical protein